MKLKQRTIDGITKQTRIKQKYFVHLFNSLDFYFRQTDEEKTSIDYSVMFCPQQLITGFLFTLSIFSIPRSSLFSGHLIDN